MQKYDELLQQAYDCIEKGRPGEAIQSLGKAARLRPDEREPLIQLAILFRELGDPQGAIALFHKALELDSEDAFALLNVGLIHYDEGEPDLAEASLKAAVDIIDRGIDATLEQLDDIRPEDHPKVRSQCEDLAQTADDARKLLAQIRAGKAETSNAQSKPESSSHLVNDDRSDTVSKTVSRAMSPGNSAEAAPILGPAENAALLESADQNRKQDNLEKAAELYRRVLDSDPSNLKARLQLGSVLYAEGHRRQALEHISHAEAVLEENIASVASGGENGSNLQADSLLADLRSILKQTIGMRNKIQLRLMFADALERRITRSYVEQNVSSLKDGKRLRIGVLITLWKRHELADLVLARCKSIKENVAPSFDLELMAVGSEGQASRELAERNGFGYLERPNDPLGAKRNAGLRMLKDRDLDAVAFVDSDDFVDERLFTAYAVSLRAGYALLGISDMYMLDLVNLQACYWPGYGAKGGRQGETLGLGRCIRRQLLDYADWKLWDDDLNRGLDNSMVEHLAPHLIASPEKFPIGTISIRDHDITAVDVKSGTNLWSFEQITSALDDVHYLSPVALLDDHFRSEEASRLLAMSEAARRVTQLLAGSSKAEGLAA